MSVVMDDAALVSRAVGGDRDAFAAIYDRYAGAVLDLCTAVLRDGEAAADAALDSFLRAARELVTLRDRSRLRIWLLAVARFEATSRPPRPGSAGDADPMGDEPGGGNGGSSSGDARRLVWDPVGELSAGDRAALHLHLRHRLDGGELGAVLGVRAAAADARAARLRELAERSVGALMLSRATPAPADGGEAGTRDAGTAACPRLVRILDGWDGWFTASMAKRVHRHARRCDSCRERRAELLDRLRAMAALPFPPPPGWLRREVLLRMELAVSSRPRPGWAEDGFPPAPGRSSGAPGRRKALVVVCVATAAMVVTAGTYLVIGGEEGDRLGATGAAPAGSTTASREVTSTAVTTVPATAPPLAPNDPTSTGADAGAPATVGPADTPPPGPGEAPVDRTPPSISFGAGVASAYTAGCPYSVIGVSAEVADESRVTSVALHVLGPDDVQSSTAMIRDGGRWVANMGNFPVPGQARFWVEAMDGEGNRARTAHQTLTVVDCP